MVNSIKCIGYFFVLMIIKYIFTLSKKTTQTLSV